MWIKVAEVVKKVAKEVIGETRVVCQRISKHDGGLKK